jgi:hypothetical protein
VGGEHRVVVSDLDTVGLLLFIMNR